jgi:uncharacterized membrane protein YgaE (UPF0421/DUF939 family)
MISAVLVAPSVDTSFSWAYVIAGVLVSGFTAAILAFFIRQLNVELKRQNAAESAKVEELKTLTFSAPEKAKPKWDLAQATLEKYFTRNLDQVRVVFAISVTMMAAGFAVMLGGAVLGFFSPHPGQSETYLATAGGVITQLIGATFIVMYRSVVTQSIQYTKTLERINAVGMAMEIMDMIPETATEQDLKSKTKSELIAVLVGGMVNRAD